MIASQAETADQSANPVPALPIQTTVVGSYPAPAWLLAMPGRSALRDAMLAVFKTQELSGIDVVTDGELSRFDVQPPRDPRHDRVFHFPFSRCGHGVQSL